MNCVGEVPVLPEDAQAVLWSARKTEGTHTAVRTSAYVPPLPPHKEQ